MLARKIEYFVTSGVGLMTDYTTLSHELRRAVVGSFLNSVNHFTCCRRGPRRFWHLVQRSPDDRVIDKDYHVANIVQKNLWLSGHVDHPDVVENRFRVDVLGHIVLIFLVLFSSGNQKLWIPRFVSSPFCRLLCILSLLGPRRPARLPHFISTTLLSIQTHPFRNALSAVNGAQSDSLAPHRPVQYRKAPVHPHNCSNMASTSRLKFKNL
mmetsp:Transcript_39352/g.156254  ORF Transcript_39352/g.156254 Transcript_39352/m.156254 type:complete len:210 (+) Transcript_39352:2318-2947(+)